MIAFGRYFIFDLFHIFNKNDVPPSFYDASIYIPIIDSFISYKSSLIISFHSPYNIIILPNDLLPYHSHYRTLGLYSWLLYRCFDFIY